MADAQNGTVKLVLISERIANWIDTSGSDDECLCGPFEIVTDNDILGRALQLLKDRGREPMVVLFFVDVEEAGRVDDFFRSFPAQDIRYAITAIATDEHRGTVRSSQFHSVVAFRTTPVTRVEFVFLADNLFASMLERIEGARSKELMTLLDTLGDQEALINIGKALSAEKDPDKLLRFILYLSKKITGADAGSIFLTETNEAGERRLRFKISDTFSKKLAYEEFTMPLDKSSIAGYVACTGSILNIPDVYALDASSPVAFNDSFDKKHGYKTRSMINVPMVNHLDQVIGVIQLINCKESKDRGGMTGNEAYEVRLETPEDFETKVAPFAMRYENLMEAVAGQAAVAIENNRMLKQIQYQFEEFVKASITAIESRDPATSGHSFRVAQMCLSMARAINAHREEPFKFIQFSDTELKELEFAALLHDFGKVYIDPSVFLKGKKLYPKDFSSLILRLNYLRRSVELDFTEKERDLYLGEDSPERRLKLEEVHGEKGARIDNLNQIINLIYQLNEPVVVDREPEDVIQRIYELGRDLSYINETGETIPLMTEDEVKNLRIKRGSLNPEERKIIESHVEHTYGFVSKIPWPDEYKNIPEIARKHHEKLDGSGYPHGLMGRNQIPIQARMMAIADIFDALAARDRPYKKAVPLEKVAEILRAEGRAGKLDPDLIELFLTQKLYVVEGVG